MTRMGNILRQMNRQEPISVRESITVLVGGFSDFRARGKLPELEGISFMRVAGQSCCLDTGYEHSSRTEIMRILESIENGGAFLVLGHGHPIKCGAVAAKQSALDGLLGEEPEETIRLLGGIPDSVRGIHSPTAEAINAKAQAVRIALDSEFSRLIERKNIAVFWSVSSNQWPMVFTDVKGKVWDPSDLTSKHPKLLALAAHIQRSMQQTAPSMGIDLQHHYSHAIALYDPMAMRTILNSPRELKVGGICCVDARVSHHTPDGPHYLFNQPPNRVFGVTVSTGSSPLFSFDDLGSAFYALGHVAGVNSLAHHGPKGNGHIVILTDSPDLDTALTIRNQLLEHQTACDATHDGDIITLMGVNKRVLRVVNAALHIDEMFQP